MLQTIMINLSDSSRQHVYNCLINEKEDEWIFEWWHKDKKLTIYLNKHDMSLDYIRTWTTSIGLLLDGQVGSPKHLSVLINWLYKESSKKQI